MIPTEPHDPPDWMEEPMTPEEQEHAAANAEQERRFEPFDEYVARAQLAKKVVEIMRAVERVPKRGRNTMQNYDYATEGDILDAIRAQCVAQGVAILPSVESAELAYKVTGRNGDIPVTRVWVEFLFIDSQTGATLTRRFPGDGMDSGDKGIYKAITGAEKYAVSKSFMVSTGDDPEQDNAGTDAGAQSRTQRGGRGAAAAGNARAGAGTTGEAPPAPPGPSSEQAINMVKALAAQAQVEVDRICAKYSVEALSDLTAAQAQDARTALERKIAKDKAAKKEEAA